MTWTTQADVRAQVQKLWDKGLMLASLAGGETIFPRRLTLKGPSSTELTDRFEQVRTWIAELRAVTHYRVVMRELRHRVIGSNDIPNQIWVDSLEDALALIGKRREAQRFSGLVALTRERQPAVLPWLSEHPLRVLALAAEWSQLIDVTVWMQAHPRPGIYMRQMDLPGIHSKFIETHCAVLSELFDLVLPAEAIDATANGANQFCRRYGFCDKPLRIRFRVLDPTLALLQGAPGQDITLNHNAFASLHHGVRQVFITENEINFLAFPNLHGSLVIFGAGYGFEMLANALWLHQCAIHYWGDIDTHGFAILDQLRAHLPHTQSLLMDRESLMAHRAQWAVEDKPERRDLPRLTPVERALYDDLRDNRIGVGTRLEQERIGFGWVRATLERLPSVV